MKKVRKNLSLLLAAALLLSTVILPINSFAEEAIPQEETTIDSSIGKSQIPTAEDNILTAETSVQTADPSVPTAESPILEENNNAGLNDEIPPDSAGTCDDILPGKVIVTLKQNSAGKYKAPFSVDSKTAVLNSSIFDNIDIADIELISPASEEDEIMTLSDDTADSPGDIFLIELNNQSEQGVFDAIKQLQANEDVLWAEPDYIQYFYDTIPNDEFYNELWGMERINAPIAWDKFTGSSDVVVGVIDGGVDYNHPDLAPNMWVNEDEIPGNGVDDDHNGYIDDINGWNFTFNHNDPMDIAYHGSHVAGIIAAAGNNGIGVTGVAWKTKIAALNVGIDERRISSAAVIKAINYATDNHFDIINGSFGGTSSSLAQKTAIERFPGLLVFAAGNEGVDTDVVPNYPSGFECENIISVANFDESGSLNSTSNYGVVSVDIAAPGTGIYSTVPGGEYKYLSGTSMAAPCVAGAAALLKGYNPSLRGAELKDIILSSVYTSSEYDKVSSGGRLDLTNLLSTADGTANDGVVNPGKLEWWTTSIEWRQYSGMDENEPYFQKCRFNIESVNVICKNKTYTVPAKTLKYDVIEANYDYEINSRYELCAKVNYDGSAEYYLDPGDRQLEMGQDNKDIAYFDDYALIWIADVYSDQNGQLFSDSAKLIVPNYTWWNNSVTYDPDNNLNAAFKIDSIQVYANGNYYNVPSETINLRPALSAPPLRPERDYSLGVQIKNNGTAEYGIYAPWADRETKGPIYNNDGILIPIFDFKYDSNYSLIVSQLWFKNDIYYPNDGIVYPGKDSWWETKIEWEKYWMDEEYYYPSCEFTLEGIDVTCKNTKYTVPGKTFVYREVAGIFDYNAKSEKYLAVKVDYNGSASYQLYDYINENNSNSPAVVYNDTYAVIPICRVFSDKNGQMFYKSKLNNFTYTNGQNITQLLFPSQIMSMKFKDIAAERETAVGLTYNGEVYVWGDGAYYDLGQGQVKLNQYTPLKVEGLPEIVKIAKGKHHVLALDVNGEVWGWGNNSSGEVHGAYKGKVYVPSKISGLNNITDIAAGTGFSAAIKSDGTLWTWGNNTDGKLGDRGTSAANVPAPVTGLSNVSKVTCGEKFMAALSGETVYTWGNNESGQLGSGTNDSTSTPTAITGSYKDIAAGNSHMLAVSTSDELFTWGYNSVGQLGLGDKISRNVPTSTGKTAAVIGAGYNHSFYTDGESIYGFGSNSKGQLGIGIQNTALTPTLIAGLRNIVKIDGGFDFTIAKDKNNNIWVFGNNNIGQLGIY